MPKPAVESPRFPPLLNGLACFAKQLVSLHRLQNNSRHHETNDVVDGLLASIDAIHKSRSDFTFQQTLLILTLLVFLHSCRTISGYHHPMFTLPNQTKLRIFQPSPFEVEVQRKRDADIKVQSLVQDEWEEPSSERTRPCPNQYAIQPEN